MKHPYEEYEASRLWEFVKSSIEDLVENNRIQAGSFYKAYHSILIEIYACRQVFYDYLNIA